MLKVRNLFSLPELFYLCLFFYLSDFESCSSYPEPRCTTFIRMLDKTVVKDNDKDNNSKDFSFCCVSVLFEASECCFKISIAFQSCL